MSEQMVEVLAPIVTAIVGVAVAALSYGARKLGNYLAEKTKLEASRELTYKLGVAAAEAVAGLNKDWVEECKAKAADGKLTKGEARAALKAAVSRVYGRLGGDWWDKLVMESGSVGGANARIADTVEATLQSQKKR
jgi:hypothetical protein